MCVLFHKLLLKSITALETQLLNIYWHNVNVFVATASQIPSDFQQAKEDCLNYIQEALLQSQWQRAAELMVSYVETLENTHTEKQLAAPEVSKQANNFILNVQLEEVTLTSVFDLIVNGLHPIVLFLRRKGTSVVKAL